MFLNMFQSFVNPIKKLSGKIFASHGFVAFYRLVIHTLATVPVTFNYPQRLIFKTRLA